MSLMLQVFQSWSLISLGHINPEIINGKIYGAIEWGEEMDGEIDHFNDYLPVRKSESLMAELNKLVTDFSRDYSVLEQDPSLLTESFEGIASRLRLGLMKMASDLKLSIEISKERFMKKASEVALKKEEGVIHQNMAITLASYEADLNRRESITNEIEAQIDHLNCSSVDKMEATLAKSLSVFESVLLLLTPSWKKILIFTLQTNLRHQPFLVASFLIDTPNKKRYKEASEYIRGKIEEAGITVVGTTQDGAMPLINTTSSNRATMMTEVWRQVLKRIESGMASLSNTGERRVFLRRLFTEHSMMYTMEASHKRFKQSIKLYHFNAGSLLSPSIMALLVAGDTKDSNSIYRRIVTFALTKLSTESAEEFSTLLKEVLLEQDIITEDRLREVFEGVVFNGLDDSLQGTFLTN
jgi:hypothetical protein